MKKTVLGKGLLALTLSATLILAGCGTEEKQTTGTADSTPKETPYLEVWGTNTGTLPIEKDGKYSQFLVKNTGIGIFSPYVPWDGGNTYGQKLNTRIATGDLPDLFLPWGGIEAQLAAQGAIADLTDYLPKYAPNLWKRIPESVWKKVKASDPSGKGKIYYIPLVQLQTYYGSFIRQDWLDQVGLKVPTTKDEYVSALKAFKEKDANGNGDPNDEIPTAGREAGKWMDHLFAMYGIAMFEGNPHWDLYDGKLTYSAVTKNMKAALEFAHSLYESKLLDNNTFLNKSADWLAKIQSDKLGSWFHISETASSRLEALVKVDKDAKLAALPILKTDGFQGFTTKMQINRPNWVIASKKGEQTIINALKLLDWANDPKYMDKVMLGVEGMHYEIKDGKPVLMAADPAKQETPLIVSVISDQASVLKALEFKMNAAAPEVKPLLQQTVDVFLANQPYGKEIAGDGLPASVYAGFPDIQSQTLYQEYMSKIILGEFPISKFDEFVDKWNKTGGEEVTKRARAWYESVSK
ncbi:extracellular solute-binding protein [Paenibacillus koleovorans]|uniref:extracellular solute-binding protein n=1 Tax=Paenibacillus koleovorans TaxID=121608 RepID=UPI000FDAEF55|nr:extracellular solute-binding protein [Paenibacillus koleovorans]